MLCLCFTLVASHGPAHMFTHGKEEEEEKKKSRWLFCFVVAYLHVLKCCMTATTFPAVTAFLFLQSVLSFVFLCFKDGFYILPREL